MRNATGLVSRSFTVEYCAWRACEDIADHPDHPLCERHYRKIGLLFIHENLDLMRAVVEAPSTTELLQRMVGEEDPEQRLAREQAYVMDRAEKRARGVVYYVRIGEHIKIGTTADLARRMGELYVQPDALLATEPGGQRVEAQRHAEFADERFNRELFEPSDRLLAHIEGLQRSPV